MVGPLVWLHLVEQRRLDVPIDPPHIPVGILCCAHSESSFFCGIQEDFVLGIEVVDGQLPLPGLEVIVELLFEAFGVLRQYPSLRKEGELFWQVSLELGQVASQESRSWLARTSWLAT